MDKGTNRVIAAVQMSDMEFPLADLVITWRGFSWSMHVEFI